VYPFLLVSEACGQLLELISVKDFEAVKPGGSGILAAFLGLEGIELFRSIAHCGGGGGGIV